MNTPSISTLILKNYNKKFDENEKLKIPTKTLDIKKLKINNLEIFKKNVSNNDSNRLNINYVECNGSLNEKKITELDFITNIDLVNKIIFYRELEIQKIIAILEYNIEIYKNIIVSMNYINEKEAAGPVKINKLQKYNDYKNEVKNYINRFIIDNKKRKK